jgi:D-alanine-D-alanine ligase
MKNKIRVAVLYGGRSGEHEVSLVSATNVILNLDRSQFDVIPIGIDKQGSWFLGDDILKQMDAEPKLRLQPEVKRLLFNPEFIGKATTLESAHALFATPERIFDVVLPMIHGPLCEDGTVQGLLELADVPYVGCGVLASAICMDKDISKRLAKAAGCLTPEYLVIRAAEWQAAPSDFLDKILATLPFPLFVKPSNTGSSVGITKVKSAEDLASAITFAFNFDTKVIVEVGINAREIEVGILEGDANAELIVSIPGEIQPADNHEFYSYASKYLDQMGVKLVLPAPLEEHLVQQIQAMAKQLFLALECEGMARCDLFLEHGTNKIYFNEINTIPGFTPLSMFPKLMQASGISYTELLTRLINLSIARHSRKATLQREINISSQT